MSLKDLLKKEEASEKAAEVQATKEVKLETKVASAKAAVYYSDYQIHSAKGKIEKNGIYFVPKCQEDIDALEAQVIRGFAFKEGE